MSLVNVCCQVEGFATGLSLIQRRRTKYGVSECVLSRNGNNGAA